MMTVSFLSHNFDDDIITDSMSIFCQIDYFVRPSEILYGEARSCSNGNYKLTKDIFDFNLNYMYA